MPNWAKKLLFLIISLPPLAGLLAWPFMVVLSVMFFDAPGSGESPLTFALGLAVWCYPMPTIMGARMTYDNINVSGFSKCLATTFITYSGILAIIFLYLAIEVFCNGAFSCGRAG